MKPHRDEGHLTMVRANPCCVCGCHEDVEAHHTFGAYLGGGRGLKGSDYGAVPLCRSCHAAEHDGRGTDPIRLLLSLARMGVSRRLAIDLPPLDAGAKARRIVFGDVARRIVTALFGDGQ